MEGGLDGMSEDMKSSFYLDKSGAVKLDDSQLMLKWGFDALYSNMGYRLIEQETGDEVLRSVDEGVPYALIDNAPRRLETGYNNKERLDVHRTSLELGGKGYYLDISRSDLLGDLANEAVIPAIRDVAVSAIVLAFFLFIVLNIVAVRLIVKPVESLSRQVAQFRPDHLGARVIMNDVPIELVPISEALNEALDRVEDGFNQQKRFVADAAHELRTPLTILLSRIELSAIEPTTLKQSLLSDTRFMSRIVEQLLDLSRAQNMVDRQMQDVDLVATVKDILSMLVPLAIEKKQDLELKTSAKQEWIKADKGELSVVIKNLIENAIKHTHSGAEILVSVDSNSLAVEDSGEGIAAEIRDRIFDRFWRADQSDRSGSGLGLAITKEILSHFDAKISVTDSDTLGGAKFEAVFNVSDRVA